VVDKLNHCISKRLDAAHSICLVVDLWTNVLNSDFVGIAAIITTACFTREIIAINMVRMTGKHTAENIKKSIEHGVNIFEFDKSKIHGNKKYF
jgi:hypothetical protein